LGKNPRGIAAAIIYAASRLNNEKCTQKEAAEAAGISEVTLRSRIKEIEKLLKRNQQTHSPT
jgi:transcription initiation factor TFIIB